ncbi:MAG: hypothetical protein PF447_07965 [Spirochaetaceae bacterium]|jgi:hypothetical protein|nr:hypothetical protein [Spirochaetaceae bacterium]
MSRGDDAVLFLEYGSRVFPLPFVEETLRWENMMIKRERTLEVMEPSIYSIGEKITGGFSCRIEQDSLPWLLALAMGKSKSLGHIAETKGLFLQGLNLNLEGDNPLFNLVINRGDGWIRYGDLQFIGFTLRGEMDSALILRLEIQGEQREELSQWESMSSLLCHKNYYLGRDNIRINQQPFSSYYRFELTVQKQGKAWDHEIVLYTSRNEILIKMESQDSFDLTLLFRLEEELEANREAYFILSLNNLLMEKEGGLIQGSGEIIGPWYMKSNSDIAGFLNTREEVILS